MEFTAEQRAVFAALGRVKSERKTAAARENGRKGGFVMKPLLSIVCTCGSEGLNHKSTCRRGQAIRYRTKKGLPLT